MCLLAMLGSQDIVVKCTVAVFCHMVHVRSSVTLRLDLSPETLIYFGSSGKGLGEEGACFGLTEQETCFEGKICVREATMFLI